MFRAVNNRCAVNFSELNLPISTEKAIETLEDLGFRIFSCDIVKAARSFIGKSEYKLGAKQFEAPRYVDCSSFTKWLYGRCGIWLPRRTIQQMDHGIPVTVKQLHAGDLIFKESPWGGWYKNDPKHKVGHVGICTGEGTIVHASNTKQGIIESNTKCFFDPKKFRGIRQFIPDPANTLFFKTPKHREVETSNDLFWIIVQTLGSKT
jgi:NlpC/P60 family